MTMQGVSGAQVQQHDLLYVQLTRVHASPPASVSGTWDQIPEQLETFLRRELASDEGTPAWRAWIVRSCARHGIT